GPVDAPSHAASNAAAPRARTSLRARACLMIPLYACSPPRVSRRSHVHFGVRIIGVIDLSGGRAMHARGGRRETYEPVRTVAGAAIENGDPIAGARAYVDRPGIRQLYPADPRAPSGQAPP